MRNFGAWTLGRTRAATRQIKASPDVTASLVNRLPFSRRRISLHKLSKNAECLGVTLEPAGVMHAFVKRLFAVMAKRRVAKIVSETSCLNYI